MPAGTSVFKLEGKVRDSLNPMTEISVVKVTAYKIPLKGA
jgi:hypothetical protein